MKLTSAFLPVVISLLPLVAHANAAMDDYPLVESLARLAEECVHKEYPNALLHTLDSAADARTPAQLHPAFYGCFDWHSSVHGHWLLARAAHLYPNTALAARAKKRLERSLTQDNLAEELVYMQRRPAFERPYGIAWLLQLAAELRQWPDPDAQRWSEYLAPLEAHGAQVFATWLPKLSLPLRSGTHSQTAFALGLVWDWSVIAEELAEQTQLPQVVEQAAKRFYANDRACPISYEPSGHDFLSPCLGEADFMRRVLSGKEFTSWITVFLSELRAKSPLLQPATVSDPTDGHLVHLDGLNLSRAWMMRNIASVLPETNPLKTLLEQAGRTHANAGLRSVIDPHYAGGHWLGTFATYLVTDRGL